MAFDLDDQEPKATRILNGVDKEDDEKCKQMNIEESIDNVKFIIRDLKASNYNQTFIKAIKTLLAAYEKEKGENVKLRLQDIPLIEGELKAYKDRVNELKEENKELNILRLELLISQFPDTTETYKKYKKELNELLKEE